jgi:type II secretory pathway pseudopilin PulG
MVEVLQVVAVLVPVVVPRLLWARAQQRRLSALVLLGQVH